MAVMPASPHIHEGSSVSALMREVMLALLPGTLLSIWWLGPGVLLHLLTAAVCALGAEALALWLRRRPLRPTLGDGSALVTAWLLALCLSPLAPWWATALAAVVAILIGKHAYGGLGRNPCNPAMVGYALVLLIWPAKLTLWPAAAGVGMDAVSAATPLAYVQTGLAERAMLSELLAADAMQATKMYAALAGAWLLGGLWLLWRGAIRWRIPVAMLLGMTAIALVFNQYDADRYLAPSFHLLHGATLLGAFFIATDPASSAVTMRGQLIYGAGIGILTWGIRTYGSHPDGVAFAVLLMNLAVPLCDHWGRPRPLGSR